MSSHDQLPLSPSTHCSGSTVAEPHSHPPSPPSRLTTSSNDGGHKQLKEKPPYPLHSTFGHPRRTLYITSADDPREKRWAYYIIDPGVPLTITDDSVWQNPFASFTFQFTHNGHEYALPETWHPHWNEERFRSLICEHQLKIPQYAEIVLGHDFFRSNPSVILKVKDANLYISKRSGISSGEPREDRAESIKIYLAYATDPEKKIGGLGLYEDIPGGQKFWKTVELGSTICDDELGLLFIALNYSIDRISAEYPYSRITLIITPTATDVVQKLGNLTVSQSEQQGDSLLSDWIVSKEVLGDVQRFLVNRRNHALALEVPELDSIQLAVPDIDNETKMVVFCTDMLAKLGATGKGCVDNERDDVWMNGSYLNSGILGDRFYWFDKTLVAMTLDRIEEFAPRRTIPPCLGSDRTTQRTCITPTKGGRGIGSPTILRCTNASRMMSWNYARDYDSSKWIKVTVSPPLSPIKDDTAVRLQLQKMKRDILREVNHLIHRHSHDFGYHEDKLAAQHLKNMTNIREATEDALSQIRDQQAQSLSKFTAAKTRNFSIPSDLKSENIRPTPNASRQVSAQTQFYSAQPQSGRSSAFTARNISAYSSQQQSVRGMRNVLQDLEPQPVLLQKPIDAEANDVISVPKSEYEELNKCAKLMTVFADLVNDLAMMHDELVPEYSLQEHEGDARSSESAYHFPPPTAAWSFIDGAGLHF